MRPKEIQQEPVTLAEVATARVEPEDFRVPRRRRQAQLELIFDTVGPKELCVDLEALQLSAPEEI